MQIFKQDFYPGEQVSVVLDDGERCEAIIREKTVFPELINPFTNTTERKAFARYVVKLMDSDKEVRVEEDNMARDRKIFTKAMLRSFIKNTVAREAWNGAPWMVKDYYANKYKISTTMPPHLQRGQTAADRKAAAQRRKEENMLLVASAKTSDGKPILTVPKSHKSKANGDGKKLNAPGGTLISLDAPDGEVDWPPSTGGKLVMRPVEPKPEKVAKPPPPPPMKYPTEDLNLPFKPEGVRRPDLEFVKALGINAGIPVSKNGMTDESVSFLLETWLFLNIYCDAFKLDSFTLDDYQEALEFSHPTISCELVVEIHCGLLKTLVQEGDDGKIEIPLPPMTHEREEEEFEDGEEGEEDEEAEEGASENGSEGSAESEDPSAQLKMEAGDNSVIQKKAPRIRVHRGDELPTDDGLDWISQLRRRDFHDGGWQFILAGLLYRQSMSLIRKDRRYTLAARDLEICTAVLEHLLPLDKEVSQESVAEQYATMDLNLRLQLLHVLTGMAHKAPLVKVYMEECSEAMTALRKRKIEHQRNRKQYLEELRLLEEERKVLLPENIPTSTPSSPPANVDSEGDTKMGDVEDTNDDEDTEGEANRSRSLRRADERANMRKRKREEEKVPPPPKSKTASQFQKVLKKIEATKASIQQEEQEIKEIDNDLREADCPRMKMMGFDRFWNRYWWFERNGMPFAGLPDSSTADSGYANGRLWIQGLGDAEREGFIEAHVDNPDLDLYFPGRKVLPMPERKQIEEGNTSLTGPTQWGFYSTPAQFDALFTWLDARGQREAKLRKELDNMRERIVESMTKRLEYLQAGQELAAELEAPQGGDGLTTRSGTRTRSSPEPRVKYRCLRWENGMALSELKHRHYDQPKVKGRGKKEKKRK